MLECIHWSQFVCATCLQLVNANVHSPTVCKWACSSGERQDDPERSENLYYHEAQIRYGPFRVEVLILSPIDREGIQARYENGFLWVDLPKKLPESKSERVRIQRSITKE